MILRLLLPFSVITIFLIACQDNNNTQASALSEEEKGRKNELVKEVMEVHDEAMPWMDQIHSLKKSLEARVDTVSSDSLIQEINTQIAQLDSADEAMMAWMREYREPSDTIVYASAREYLLKQKEKIEIVRAQMDSAITNAKTLVK